MKKPVRAASPAERRAAPRYALRVPVEMDQRGAHGKGMVDNISSLGARIEHTDLQPAEGSTVSLRISLLPNSVPLCLQGEVVRLTRSGGFCVRFLDLDVRVGSVLRTALPRLADGLVTEDDESTTGTGTRTGRLQIDIGSDLHTTIAELAEMEGVEASDWVRGRILRSAQEALRRQPAGQCVRTGHNPETCPNCQRKRRDQERRERMEQHAPESELLPEGHSAGAQPPAPAAEPAADPGPDES